MDPIVPFLVIMFALLLWGMHPLGVMFLMTLILVVFLLISAAYSED